MAAISDPRCVAVAVEEFTTASSIPTQTSTHLSNFFRSVQWSADGTTLIASSSDNYIRTYVVPADLLQHGDQPHSLPPYSTIISHEPLNAVVGYTGFDLQNSATTLILSSIKEHPIRLSSALTTDLVASYPLVNPMTEQYTTPHSLAFTHDGSHFIAGSDSLISIFDLQRSGQPPSSSFLTGPKSRKVDWFNPSMHMRGIVSALAIEPATSILAAGTFGRSVGLYGSNGQGECLGIFSVEGTQADKDIAGQGITQLLWSPCGRYLYIAERKSEGVMVYDIRKTGQLLSWLSGRHAGTNQRLGIDLSLADDGGNHEVWAGGTDGNIRMWRNPQLQEGAVVCEFTMHGHDDPIVSAVMHRSGGVLATASGQRHLENFWDGGEDQNGAIDVDNSLKIWSL